MIILFYSEIFENRFINKIYTILKQKNILIILIINK